MRLQAVAVILLLTGCMTSEKAKRKLDKIEKDYPELVSEICAVEYPCIPRKADTILRTEYDFIEVECPDGQLPITSRDSTDTVYIIKYNERRVTKEIKIPCESKIITQYLEDTAKVAELSNRLAKSDEAYKVLKAKAQKSKRFNWILAAVLALLILVLYLRRKK